MLKERPCSCEQRGGDRRKPPESRSYWPGRSNYSGQPVGGQKKKDIKGQLLEVTDPLGRVNFRHKYDTAGNNLRTEHLDSGVKTMVVDALGQPLYGDDAKGARTYTSHDRLGRPTGVWARNKATEPFTKRQVLIYGDQQYDVWPPEEKNLKGRLYQHYDEAGKVQVEGYDFKGNPLEKARRMIKDDQAQPLFVHVVDWTGLDESILDAKAYTTTVAYDALNRVLGTLLPEDVNSHRTAVRPTYNRAGALRSVLVDEAPYLVDIAYNAKGQRLLMAMANGMMTRYAYDPLNFRLLRIRSEKFTMGSPVMYVPNGGVQQDLGYRYDLVGNIIGIRDKAPANHSAEGPGDLLKQFNYDPLKRLLTATGRESTAPSALPLWDAGIRAHDHTATNTYTRAYTYDKVGNVLEEQHTADGHPANSFTKTFNYHPAGADNRLVSYEVGGLTFPLTYDAAGNQLKETTSRFHYWDHADLLRYFEVRAGAGAPSVWAHYFYDASGTRVKKMVGKLVGGSILQEVTVYIDGVFEETYVQTNGSIDPGRHYNTLHVMDGRSRIATIRVGNDTEDPTPPVKFNLEDHLGTSSVVLDQYGGLINREEYYPFGDTCFGAFAKKRYRYCGKEKDSESGLYYYGMRYYAPWMCRFISVDPLAHDYPHYTPYQYAGNKPINFIDLDGLEEADPSNGNLNVNIYIQRDPNDSGAGTTPTDTDAVARWSNNWSGSINAVWNSGNLTITNQADGLQSTVNTSGVTFSEVGPNFDPSTLGKNDILFTVGAGGSIQNSHPGNVASQTSFVNGDNAFDAGYGHGYMFTSDMQPLTGAHEFGHLFGLSDRYHEAVSYSSNQDQLNGSPRNTVPMVLPDPSIDTQYDPLNNLYSAGQPRLTDMQLGIVFSSNSEERYPTVVAINSASATYEMIQVIESGSKPQVTSFKRNGQGVDKVGTTNVNWARPQGNGFQTNGQIAERALTPNRRLTRNLGPNQTLVRQRYQ